jgi:leucyl aminopeptidase
VLVGKAITFDTGGYSIKPAKGMEGLKFDKCGGVSVLGVLKAAATLKLKCNLVGIVAAAENAISERAYRPGDILKMASGKTVEVISTDAEGRLVLGDALWYAQKYCKPTALIDLATLTGGVGIALGQAAAGLMSNDDSLAADLGECGRRTHERLWRLPLWEDYRELIKGADADIKNAAGKQEAHAIVGGMFLKEFVNDDVPWAHLDIASVAITESDNAGGGKGATGFGVRLLIEYLRRRIS